MEDRAKDSPPLDQRPPRREPAPSRTNALTVMVLRGVGRIRTFSLSPRILLGASLFLFFYLVVSLFIINDYFDLRIANQVLNKRLKDMAGETQRAKAALYRSEQRRRFLENAMKEKSGPRHSLSQTSQPETRISPRALLSAAAPPPGPVRQAKDPASPQVRIKGVSLKRAGTRLSVFFKVVNASEDAQSVRGYVHVIALDDRLSPPQFWTFPKVALKEGLPINYKRGYFFIIKHFKTIRAEYFLDSEQQDPTSIRFLVYDESGSLVLNQEFRAEELS